MSSINRVILVGRLTKDPVVRRTQSGDPVASFSLATNETWTDKQSGERKEKVEFHNIVVFNKGLAGVAEKYLRKGSQIYLEGQLQTRKWQDQSGNDRYSTEIVLSNFSGNIVMLGGKDDGKPGKSYALKDDSPWDDAPMADFNDSVPF